MRASTPVGIMTDSCNWPQNMRNTISLLSVAIISFVAGVPAADSEGHQPTTAATAIAEVTQAFQNLTVEQFDKLRADKANTVLDVRTKREFDAGHVPGAVHMDVKGADFAERAAKLDKSATYLVYCASGGRSVAACNKLSPLGFRHLLNLEHGYNAWEQARKQDKS